MTEQEKEENKEEPQTPETPESPKAPTTPAVKSGSGLEPNVAGLLCYVPYIGIVIAIVFLIIEKNKFVKFHAIQSIILSLVLYAFNFLIMGVLFASMMSGGFALFGLLTMGVTILYIVLWIVLMVKAYNNEEWELPIIGSIAKGMVK